MISLKPIWWTKITWYKKAVDIVLSNHSDCIIWSTIIFPRCGEIFSHYMPMIWIYLMQFHRIILETDPNVIAGKVASHSMDADAPLAEQVMLISPFVLVFPLNKCRFIFPIKKKIYHIVLQKPEFCDTICHEKLKLTSLLWSLIQFFTLFQFINNLILITFNYELVNAPLLQSYYLLF